MLKNYAVPGLMTHVENFQEIYAIVVRHYLDIIWTLFGRQVIGQVADIDMPPNSKDILLIKFFVWGIVKNPVYSKKPQTTEQMKDYTEDTFHDLDSVQRLHHRVCNYVPERLKKISEDGKQFKHKNNCK